MNYIYFTRKIKEMHIGALALVLMVSACASLSDDGGFVVQNQPTDKNIRIGLLLPFSAKNKEVKALARSLSDAAQMALFDSGKTRLVLIPQDTRGTPEGAVEAMKNALDKGADIILGPLLANEVQAITKQAQDNNVPVIAFSSDERIVQDNIYLLGFSPREQVRRILFHAQDLNVRSIAAFLPQTAYGRLVRDAFVHASNQAGFDIHAIETYLPSVEAALEPASRLADFTLRRKARDQELRRLERVIARAKTELRLRGPQAKKRRFVRGRGERSREQSSPPQARLDQAKAAIQRLKKIDTLGEIPYQAILFAEGGNLLRGIVQLLPNFDITSKQVFFLGTGLWDDRSLSREQPLNGARFAAPPVDNAAILLSRMRSQFQRRPKRLATLGYDAIGFVLALTSQSDPPFSYEQITQREGFAGIDGIFRFNSNFTGQDGKPVRGAIAQRGLAVIEISRRSRNVVVDAPQSFGTKYFRK